MTTATPRFIALDGADGAGKSVQADRLAQNLRDQGHHVERLRAPGGSVLAEELRTLVLANEHAGMDHVISSNLFALAWRSSIQELVDPALAEGAYVVCDRNGYVSGPVYAGGHPADLADGERRLRADASDLAYRRLALRAPDLTILLDVSPNTALERRGQCPDALNRFDPRDRDTAARLRLGYLALARSRADILTVDASADASVVEARVLRCVVEGVGSRPPGTMSDAPWMAGVCEGKTP